MKSICVEPPPAPKHTLVSASRRTAVILQPSYLPWLGYFAQLERSDVFVIYDDVQFDKESWRNRNRIKTAHGPQWLTVPVLTKGKNFPTNRDIAINNAVDWRRKHLASIQQSYSKAPFIADYFPLFQRLYAREWKFLIDLNLASFEALTNALGLRREIRLSSELSVGGASVPRLIDLCRAVDADCFYEGAAGRNYIDGSLFDAAGIRLEYQDYEHPLYPQLHGEFIPYLSIIDLLFNCGPKSLHVLKP